MSYVDELEISTRTKNLLVKTGISTREEFDALEEVTFSAVRGAGRRLWLEIAELQDAQRDGMRLRKERPVGYRICSAPIRQTAKAVLVGYYGWMLWLPKRAVVLVDDRVCASLPVIENAKDFAEKKG